MTTHDTKNHAFTLIELLVVTSILFVLVGVLLPSLQGVAELARQVRCLDNLHSLGNATAAYAADNGDFLFPGGPCSTDFRRPYYWGTNTDPVKPEGSPLLRYARRESLLCPSLDWGEYFPQGAVNEPTTCFGYNAFCLDPESVWMAERQGLRKVRSQIPAPEELFVFVDAALVNTWARGGIFQNSTFVDPPEGMQVKEPMTHFRHVDRADALCLDGHANGFGLEGERMINPQYNLSFVGKANHPHYDQKREK
jgi:type II secretory pathway pseudopilin PulG